MRHTALFLLLVALLALVPLAAFAANSGGIPMRIEGQFAAEGSYVGSKDGSTPTATGGNVFIDTGVAASVVGGYSSEAVNMAADVSHNRVTIGTLGGDNSFMIGEYVYGGYSSTDTIAAGNAHNNTLIIYSGTLKQHVYGGYSSANTANSGSANNNSVIIYGGEIMNKVYGGRTLSTVGHAGNANYNTVTIYSSMIDDDVSGGHSGTAEGQAGNTNHNTVNIHGGNVGGIVYGGHSHASTIGNAGNASYNTVNIYGGTIDTHVEGGSSTAAGLNSTANSGDASYNTVNIYGGTIEGNVYGARSNAFGSTVGNATYNTVNIYGGTFDSTSTLSTILYGGAGANSPDKRTGNTLNIYASGIAVGNVANFQYYNFALSSTNNATLLTLSDTEMLTPYKSTEIDDDDSDKKGLPTAAGDMFEPGDRVKVIQVNGGQRLAVGHSNTLLKAENGTLSNLTLDIIPNGQVQQGVSLVYDYTLTVDNIAAPTAIIATITGVQAAPEGKALSEGRAAGLGFVNMGADLIAGAGMDNARSATEAGKGLSGGDSGSSGGLGLIPFFALSASSLRYNTGSHTDVQGIALLAGLAKKWETPAADVLLGAFFEAAWGSYKSHNSFASGTVDGQGHTRAVGGGILARIDLTDTLLKGLYAEGSFRAGGLNSDYRTEDLRDPLTNRAASYEIASTYYGAHAGVGYLYHFTDNVMLDIYAKYFWTHQTGQDVTILGDRFEFKDMDSQRLRLGARFSYAVNEYITPYIGAAWEYEFNGRARATTYGLDVPAPSLKGDTGIGEVGIRWKPAPGNGFSVDVAVQGFIGKREGVAGNVSLKYEF